MRPIAVRRDRFHFLAVGTAVGFGLALAPGQGSATPQVVALSGQQAPDVPEGVTFIPSAESTVFGYPCINAAGQVAFSGHLNGPAVGSFEDWGVWVGQPGALRLAVRNGELIDSGADVIGQSYAFAINQQGAFLYTATKLDATTGERVGNVVLRAGAPGAVRSVMEVGQDAPGTANLKFSWLHSQYLSAAGRVVFSASVNPTGTDIREEFKTVGVWTEEENGSLSVVVAPGMPAPQLGPGVRINTVSGFAYGMQGLQGWEVAFPATLEGEGIDDLNNSGIWAGPTGDLQLIARKGEPAADMPGDVRYTGFSPVAFNSQGKVLFSAGLASDGFTGSGLFVGWRDEVKQVALSRASAAGFDPSCILRTWRQRAINSEGQVALSGWVVGPGLASTFSTNAIWAGLPGSLALIVREGDAAPGVEGGVFTMFSDAAVFNARGQLAFWGVVAGPGTDSSTNAGVWVYDPAVGLLPVVREGDLITIAIGDQRTVSSVGRVGNDWDRGGDDLSPTSLNDSGQLALQLSFRDGSEGVFIFTIPEPGSALVLVLAACSHASNGRRCAPTEVRPRPST